MLSQFPLSGKPVRQPRYGVPIRLPLHLAATGKIAKLFFGIFQAKIKRSELSKETIEQLHRNKADPGFHFKAEHRKAPSLPVIY